MVNVDRISRAQVDALAQRLYEQSPVYLTRRFDDDTLRDQYPNVRAHFSLAALDALRTATDLPFVDETMRVVNGVTVVRGF